MAARLSAASFEGCCESRRGVHVPYEQKGVIHHICICFSIDLNIDNSIRMCLCRKVYVHLHLYIFNIYVHVYISKYILCIDMFTSSKQITSRETEKHTFFHIDDTRHFYPSPPLSQKKTACNFNIALENGPTLKGKVFQLPTIHFSGASCYKMEFFSPYQPKINK